MSCMLVWVVEKDIDWVVWVFIGVYYFCEGKCGVVEVYGMLDVNWYYVYNYIYF